MARKFHASPSGHTILVIDDQPEVLTSVRRLLEREGHEVLTAESGERALALFKEHDVHLILVDYFMPGMTGEEVIREIRRFDPYVQIVLQTGYAGDKPARQMMAELDIQGYQDKTEGPERLLLWVDVGLKAHRLVGRLRQRERLQGELVANVSHEFRTPLNVVGGYTELLREGHFGALPEATEKPLRAIQQATQSLADLVSDFLSYAKTEAGAMRVAEEWIDVPQLAHELSRLAMFLLEGRDVSFAVDAGSAPAQVFTDVMKLRTILRNLVTNAVKFTNSGEITLGLTREGTTATFTVRDTGPGIPAQALQMIFEPFRQLDGSLTRHHGGIGLGLALSRKLAHLLGGDLTAESTVDVGSLFTLTLPDVCATDALPGGAVGADDADRGDAILSTTHRSHRRQPRPGSSTASPPNHLP